MKILSLSIDPKILNSKESAHKRQLDYASRLEKMQIIVPAEADSHQSPAHNLDIFGIGGIKPFALLKIYFLASNLIRKDRPQVISVQDQYYLALVAWALAKKYKIGFELQVHGFEKLLGIRAFIFKFVVKRANAIRTVSLRFKNILLEKYKLSEEKITVVPIQVSNKKPSGLSSIKGDKFIFLSVGRFVPIKRFDLLIKAYTDIYKQIPKSELWIAGEGAERGRLEELIVNNNLGEKIRLLGWQDDLNSVYSQTSCFVLCSDQEGWGMSVIEASHFGLPVIMTDVGLAGEIVIDNESGLVIPINDSQALGRAMLRIYQDSDLRERLIEGIGIALKKLPSEEETLNIYLSSWGKARLM